MDLFEANYPHAPIFPWFHVLHTFPLCSSETLTVLFHGHSVPKIHISKMPYLVKHHISTASYKPRLPQNLQCQGSMFQKLLFPKQYISMTNNSPNLYYQDLMFPKPYIPKVPCLHGQMLLRTVHSHGRCSQNVLKTVSFHAPVIPNTYISKLPRSPSPLWCNVPSNSQKGPMFPKPYIPRDQHSYIQMFCTAFIPNPVKSKDSIFPRSCNT